MRIFFTDSDADYKKIFGEFLLQRIGIQYPPYFQKAPILTTNLSLWSESECGEDPYSSIVPIRIIPKTSKIVPSVKATTYTYYAALFYFTSNLI